MKIVYLYTELMPYNIAVIMEHVKLGAEVFVFYYDKNRKTPYLPPRIDGVTYYSSLNYDNSTLWSEVSAITPDILYVSGWVDKRYNNIAYRFNTIGNIPVIAASDTQWRGGKQWLNVLTTAFRHKKWFSHILVAGIWQYEYARRLGFPRHRILLHCLSADIDTFAKVNIEQKIDDYPKNILFVGRFAEVKGLDRLLSAWSSIENKNGWTLTLIGNGPLRDTLTACQSVIIKGFMSQEELVIEAQNSGCFILPSVFEPWALVLHEFAAAGLPILCSNRCGATPYFVMNGYNGFLFSPDNIGEIKQSIENIIACKTDQLIDMSIKSRLLSARINPDIVSSVILNAKR